MAFCENPFAHQPKDRPDFPKVPDDAMLKAFDDITVLATMLTGTSLSFINILTSSGQWIRIGGGVQNVSSHEMSFSDFVMKEDRLVIIEDVLKDDRFRDDPLARGSNKIRRCAGLPLRLNGRAVGAFCLFGPDATEMSGQQRFALEALRDQVEIQILQRHENQLLQQAFTVAERQKSSLQETNEKLHSLTHDLVISEAEVRKRLEEIKQLKANIEIRESQYRELVEKASDLIYELDASGRFSFVNSTMEAASGYSIDQLREMHYWELVHPVDVARVTEFYKKQLKERRETSYLEFRIRTAAGKEIWIGQNVRMYFDESGYVPKVASISRDITDLKHTEHKLEESEKLYRLLSTNSKDIICLFDADENITRKYASPSVETILGYTPEELIGKSGYFWIFPEDLEHVKSVTKEQTLKGKPASIECRVIKKDGTVIWIESNSSPIFDESGKVTGFQTAARDITSRKAFEVSLKAAKQKAEEAADAKSQFLSMMSHEIRTPMNAIIGLTNLMLESNTDPDQMEKLKLLRFSGENLLTIINDILDFSKIEANKITIDSVQLNLNDLMLNTKMILEQRANEKKLYFYLHFDERIPKKLYGDPVRISQIITNLAGNAIKFTDSGSVKILVLHEGKQERGHVIRFEVADTGIGIPADKLENIFDRFSQGGSDITRRFGGTGLGLSITKSLLGLMGSSVQVESKYGEGSRFWFTLVMREASAHPTPALSARDKGRIASSEGVRILLVEDNKVNQVVAVGFLKRWGIVVDIANNGREALSMVSDKSYDVVLMDLQMPEMDGYEACGAIRNLEDPYFQTLPILALTASAMTGMKDKVLDAGMTDFVTKPFSPDELRAKILKYARPATD